MRARLRRWFLTTVARTFEVAIIEGPFEVRLATMVDYRQEVDLLLADIADAVTDYRKIFPEPAPLAPNLALAVRAAELLAPVEKTPTPPGIGDWLRSQGLV